MHDMLFYLRLFTCRFVLLMAFVSLGSDGSFAKEIETGETIYNEQCAYCHGTAGDGTKKTTRALVGDKSLSQLAVFIQKAMPEDDPGTCTVEESKKVAEYIYTAFYSPDAQARLHPQQVSLSHLTVAQYRNAVADVIGSFRQQTGSSDGKQGLHGEYFSSKDTRGDKRMIDRIDPEINFDFGLLGPDTGTDKKIDADTFCIRWDGSVLAPETGTYEFVVHTEHALKFWVNEMKNPVVDAMVKSGSDTEYRASLFLIGGRRYSIRLEVFKGRNNSDKKKDKIKPAKASVSLGWLPPKHQKEEIIPARFLSAIRSAEVAVIATPFPPDDRSYGWERGTSVSREWVAATADAAMDVAGYVEAHLQELSGAANDAKDREAKLRIFCRTFAERAFRRPLTEDEKKQLVDRQFEGGADLALAMKRCVIRVLVSPDFLYPAIKGKKDSYAVAARLALVLWDSMPDQTLLTAAAQGKLTTRDQIAQQAERMINDPRARNKLQQFLLSWLKVEQSPEIVKDLKKYSDFDPAVAADLRTSMELFLEDIANSEMADFRQLLVSDNVFLNGRLAKFYSADLPADAKFTKVKMDNGRRAGVLTQPYMLSAFAYPEESSPIHRGVVIIRGILGVTLLPPANATFKPFSASEHPGLTTRERISLQTRPDSCVGCHAVINSLGFTLEQYDAVGRYREKEHAKLIDVSGQYNARDGSVAKFAGARELARYLADSDETHEAFSRQMFQQFVKQPVRAYGLESSGKLKQKFAEHGYNIRKLLVEIAVIASQ